MSDTRWLTPLIDHTQIATTVAGAPADAAVVLVRCGDGRQAPLIWRAATVTPATLGDYDGEATDIAATITGPYISPVIVLTDPSGRHRAGCDTQSHWTGDTAHLNRHTDCHHQLAAALLHPGRRRRQQGTRERE